VATTAKAHDTSRADEEGHRRAGSRLTVLWAAMKYPIGFLVLVGIGALLSGGPKAPGISVGTYIWLYVGLAFLAVTAAILGGLDLFRRDRHYTS
jgi:hypothetical protein